METGKFSPRISPQFDFPRVLAHSQCCIRRRCVLYDRIEWIHTFCDVWILPRNDTLDFRAHCSEENDHEYATHSILMHVDSRSVLDSQAMCVSQKHDVDISLLHYEYVCVVFEFQKEDVQEKEVVGVLVVCVCPSAF